MNQPTEHNYLKRLLELRDSGAFPTCLYDVEVAHDNWCGFNRGQRCNCDPDIRIRKLFPRSRPRPSAN
jgi:hypothetical protein